MLAIVLVGLALRLRGLGEAPIWVDEANAYRIASQDGPAIVGALRNDSSPPLYYFLLHGWMALCGSTAAVLRLPSVLFGLVLITLVHHVGKRSLSAGAGLWAAWLVATSPSQIYYSQQVRMYSLLALLALAATYALVRALESGSWRVWSVYVVATVATLLTHNFGFHVLPVHVLVGLLALFRGTRPWRLVFALGAVALLYAPWLPIFLDQLDGPDTYSWFEPIWERTGVARSLLHTFQALGPGGTYLSEGWPTPRVGALTLVGLVLVILGAQRAPLWFSALLCLPIATALCLSFHVTPHYVAGRVDQMMLPAYTLLAGAGLVSVRIPARLLRWTVVAVAALPLAAGIIVRPEQWPQASDGAVEGLDRELAQELVRRSQPGDTVVCTSLSRAPLEYELDQHGVGLRLLSFPRSTAEHLGGQDDRVLLAEPSLLAAEVEGVLAAAFEGAEGGCVHFVLVEAEVNRPLRARLEQLLGSGALTRASPTLRFGQRGVKQFVHLETLVR